MSTKPKKEQQARQIFNIEGGIHAGRDVIQGDQYNYQVANVETPAQFVAELGRIQAGIAELKQEKLNAPWRLPGRKWPKPPKRAKSPNRRVNALNRR